MQGRRLGRRELMTFFTAGHERAPSCTLNSTARTTSRVSRIDGRFHLKIGYLLLVSDLEIRSCRDGKPLSTGGIGHSLRGLNGKTMPHLISVPKEDPKPEDK